MLVPLTNRSEGTSKLRCFDSTTIIVFTAPLAFPSAQVGSIQSEGWRGVVGEGEITTTRARFIQEMSHETDAYNIVRSNGFRETKDTKLLQPVNRNRKLPMSRCLGRGGISPVSFSRSRHRSSGGSMLPVTFHLVSTSFFRSG